MNLNEAAENAYKTAIERQKNGGNVSITNVLKHAAGEIMEAAEAYVFFKFEDDKITHYSEELADVIICILIAARRDGIDIEKAVCKKMLINEQRAKMQGDKL